MRECDEAESIAGVRRARAGGQRAGAMSRQGPHQPCQGPWRSGVWNKAGG